jgi:hypothetical protein
VVVGEPGFAHIAVEGHPSPWARREGRCSPPHRSRVRVPSPRHRPDRQLDEVASARWVPVADVVDLPTPAELPELVAAASQWAKTEH